MATHDYVLANASGASFRADLNNALAAIVSNNSNATSPATTYAYQWWADTTANQLKLRNSANDDWIVIQGLDGTMLMQNGSAASPGLSFASDLDTGLFRSAANKLGIATNGAERVEFGTTEVVFNDIGADVNFRIEGDDEANLFFVDAGTNRLGVGTSSPASLLHVDTGAGNFQVSSFGSTSINIENSTASGAIQHIAAGGHRFSTTSSTELVRITGSGDVGIGTTTPTGKLHVETGSGDFKVSDFGSDSINIENSQASGAIRNIAAGGFRFNANDSTELVRITGTGDVGIGTSSPASPLHVDTGAGNFQVRAFGSDSIDLLNTAASGAIQHIAAGGHRFSSASSTELVRITGTGEVGIGTSSPANLLHVDTGAGNFQVRAFGSSSIDILNTASTGAIRHIAPGGHRFSSASSAELVRITANGNVGIGTTAPTATLDINGSLSKNSGSFKIDHPLPALAETHHLVHSFVEAPDASNLYAGMVDLVDGTATVNIDTAHRMTEGTFVALNTVQSWSSSNETGYAPVKCSISGNLLTIECQDAASTDTVYYKVRGIRKDQHMLDTEWTDENGTVITEPLKVTEEVEAA